MRMGIWFLKLAALYFLIGVSMGLVMEMMGDHSLAGAHAHINLLGWASMGLFGFIYILFPNASETLLAKLHFWLYNVSFPLFMLGLSFFLASNTSLTVLLMIFPNLLVLSVILFVINMFINLKAEDVAHLLKKSETTSL